MVTFKELRIGFSRLGVHFHPLGIVWEYGLPQDDVSTLALNTIASVHVPSHPLNCLGLALVLTTGTFFIH